MADTTNMNVIAANSRHVLVLVTMTAEDGTVRYHRTSLNARTGTRGITEVNAHLQRLGADALSEADQARLTSLVGATTIQAVNRWWET